MVLSHGVVVINLDLAIVFKVSSQTLYLTDDSNIAIFPAQSGYFSALDFTARGHYEVHGDEVEKGVLTPGTPLSTPTASQRFSFTRNTPPSAAAGSPARLLQDLRKPP